VGTAAAEKGAEREQVGLVVEARGEVTVAEKAAVREGKQVEGKVVEMAVVRAETRVVEEAGVEKAGVVGAVVG
jgi:hypothetical protein